jgi:phosphomannomutase
MRCKIGFNKVVKKFVASGKKQSIVEFSITAEVCKALLRQGYSVDSKTVNDKDGISAAIFLAQIATDLAKSGLTLSDLLNEVWSRHGFHGTEQISIRVSDMSSIARLLTSLRKSPPREIASRAVKSIDDLAAPQDGLPPTDGVRIWLDGDIRVIVRPSGTEAKMKCYIEVVTATSEESQKLLDEIRGPLKELLS